MSPSNPYDFEPFQRTPEQILANRRAGKIYSADFRSGEGKYISSVIESSDPIDASIKVSPRIELRITYLIQDAKVSGVQISKLNTRETIDKIHLSTLDWDGVLKLLHIFGNVDLKSVASGSLILDRSIISNPAELDRFLSTVSADPEGKKKLEEVAKNFGFLKPGDVDTLAIRRTSTELMEKLLDDPAFFQAHKIERGIGKDEEVWQQFFQANDWLLGSDVVEVLEERGIDEDSIADLPVKSLDGFLDIIELKLPSVEMWTQDINPTAELTKATMQCMRYVTEYERRYNDHKKIEELGVDILKPRITLIYGRSCNWEPRMNQQLRVLNSSYHNITVLTYDHVLQRAKKLTGKTDF